MNVNELVAIDVHTHAEISTKVEPDEETKARIAAMAKYFKGTGRPPTIPEVAAYYRERKMAAVIFPVDSESASGQRRVSNEEVLEEAAHHSDALIPFVSIDPAKGRMGVREARHLLANYPVRGFKEP